MSATSGLTRRRASGHGRRSRAGRALNPQDTRTLPAPTSLARFLQHVLPRGFAKVRHSGLASPTCRRQLEAARAALSPAPTPVASSSSLDEARATTATEPVVMPEVDRCPGCHVGRLVVIFTQTLRRGSARQTVFFVMPPLVCARCGVRRSRPSGFERPPEAEPRQAHPVSDAPAPNSAAWRH